MYHHYLLNSFSGCSRSVIHPPPTIPQSLTSPILSHPPPSALVFVMNPATRSQAQMDEIVSSVITALFLYRGERTFPLMSSNRYPGSVSERGVLCLVEMSFCPTMFVSFFSFVWTWINWNKNVIFWNWSRDWKLKLKFWKQNILPFATDSIRESFRLWLHLLQLYYSSSIQNNYWYIYSVVLCLKQIWLYSPTFCANTKGKKPIFYCFIMYKMYFY